MAKTSGLNLNITSSTDDTMTFKAWRDGIAGDNPDSNMVIIDEAIIKLRNKIIFSPTQPTTQSEGDVWNEEIM